MNIKYLSTIILIMIISLPITIAMNFQKPTNVNMKAMNEKAIKSSADEKLIVTTIVLNKETPENVIKEIYNMLKNMYTINENNKIIETKISKIVKDREGRYLIHVYDDPYDIKKILFNYEMYIDDIIYKPRPQIMPITPEINIKNIKPGPTNMIIRELLGVDRVEAEYGVNGSGINIAIVDTGVDYAHPDLRDTLKYVTLDYKGEYIREPLVLDADESQVILLTSVISSNDHIYVGGLTFITLIPYPIMITAPYDSYTITNLTSKSGVYKFGVAYMLLAYNDIVWTGVLMYDSNSPGIYDSLVIDLNFDGDFTNDPVITYYGDRIISKDYDGDGLPDISLGVAGGFFYDFWWWFSYPAEFHPGWDKSGRYISIFYDFYGHGTQCASAAAGRGKLSIYIPGFGNVTLPGIARGASIIGIKALWVGNTEVGMLWAAGFDIDPYTGRFYYTGNKRADIISNSWGISTFTYDIAGFGYDFESMFINGLSIPGFLSPDYPGILIIQAGGNGGSGYGTITSPGAAIAALTVGASTSTHFAYVLSQPEIGLSWIFMSGGGWVNDDVISWSLRGPTPAGYIKPDVVNVGAFGFTAAAIPLYWDIFGGTSYATPLTAGVAALVYQILGKSASPMLIKDILTSTADPISYEPFAMGSGRVNAYRAVSQARILSGKEAKVHELLFYSNSIFENTYDKMSNIWYWMWKDWIAWYMLLWAGTELSVPSPLIPTTWKSLYEETIYVPDIAQGESKDFKFTIYNPINTTVDIILRPIKIVLNKKYTSDLSLTLPEYEYMAYDFVTISRDIIPSNTVLMKVDLTMPYKFFDQEDNYVMNIRDRIWIYIWKNDTNGNEIPDSNELILINYGYRWSNSQQVYVKNPLIRLEKYGPNAKIVARVDIVRGPDTPWDISVPNIPLRLVISYYEYDNDTWISIPSNVSINPRGLVTLNGHIEVPETAPPTVYQSFIIAEYIIDNIKKTVFIPLSYTVYTNVTQFFKTLNEKVIESDEILYNWKYVKGHFSWSWRYESGDWRIFYVKVDDPLVTTLEYEYKWTSPYTSVVIYTLGPDGQFAGAHYTESISWHIYLGSGTFMWFGTGAGSIKNAKRTIIFPSTGYREELMPTPRPNTGIYTLISHVVLYGGEDTNEEFEINVRGIKAESRLPLNPQINGGRWFIRFRLPYTMLFLYAYTSRPHTPILDYDQRYAPGDSKISPEFVRGPYPSNTRLTFIYSAINEGAPGTRIDFSTEIWITFPSMPIYSRYGWQYALWSYNYLFLEDWVITVK